MGRLSIFAASLIFLVSHGGCATQKESFTARTGVEQLLISSAVDKALDNLDFTVLQNHQVFFDTKYLDCVDKNYIYLAIRHRMMLAGATLLDKADKAEIIVEAASGAVGTDGQETFVGIPEIPLPPPSPIAIPRLAFLTRTKMNGTAKILVVAYDAKTKALLVPTGLTLARSDQKNWNVLGMGNVQTGSVPREIAATTKETDLSMTTGINFAAGAYSTPAPRFYNTPGAVGLPVSNPTPANPGPAGPEVIIPPPNVNQVSQAAYGVITPNNPVSPVNPAAASGNGPQATNVAVPGVLVPPGYTIMNTSTNQPAQR